MKKGVEVYLFIAILLIFSVYLIIDEPEKVAIKDSQKVILQNKKYNQNEDIKIEYTTTNKTTNKLRDSTHKKNTLTFNKDAFDILETKQKLTQKQLELKKRYEVNQQRRMSQVKYNHIKESNNRHQNFLELRANYIKQANQNIQNIPDIQKKLAYEDIQNKNKMQIMMLNRSIK